MYGFYSIIGTNTFGFYLLISPLIRLTILFILAISIVRAISEFRVILLSLDVKRRVKQSLSVDTSTLIIWTKFRIHVSIHYVCEYPLKFAETPAFGALSVYQQLCWFVRRTCSEHYVRRNVCWRGRGFMNLQIASFILSSSFTFSLYMPLIYNM